MGYDMRPATWDGQERPKISAKLRPCACGASAHAHVDTVGMWSVAARDCRDWLGDDGLGFETWQEMVREWNARQPKRT